MQDNETFNSKGDDMTDTKQAISALIAELGLTMECRFVPFSQSRSKGEKHPSLNWIVTIKRNGRDVVTTDYMQGIGHCPAYKASVAELGNRNCIMRDEAIRLECENGKVTRGNLPTSKTILPTIEDVLHSLVSDSDALDYSNYEDWADSLGYDSDSRKGEAIYRACLEIALKLRNGLGEANLPRLREAYQDY